MKKEKGFTLVEILIVVVILAVLAAMILPRFLGQTENAFIAEAQQNLGAMRRGQQRAFDMNNSYTAYTAAQTAAAMPGIGLGTITATNFTYSCAATGTCAAARVGNTTSTVTLDINGNFDCAGSYEEISNQRGCRVAR